MNASTGKADRDTLFNGSSGIEAILKEYRCLNGWVRRRCLHRELGRACLADVSLMRDML